MIRGNIEALKANCIIGWVADDEDWNRELRVAFTSRRGKIFRTQADQMREDLQRSAVGTGKYGFKIPLPWPIEIERTEGKLFVSVEDEDGNVLLSMAKPWQDFEAEDISVSLLPTTGQFEALSDGKLTGWITSPNHVLAPYVTVSGRPLSNVKFPVDLPQDKGSDGRGDILGFAVDVAPLKKGESITLHAHGKNQLIAVDEISAPEDRLEEGFIAQLEAARRLATLPGAVAITCWDGAHNPVGRAKVLFDIVAHKRPAIIVCYVNKDFGGEIWKPLKSSNAVVLAIPWERRHRYEEAIRVSGIAFDTVWICKPRLSSFRLAALVSHAETALILDFDDNEEHFSSSENAKEKSYGQSTVNLNNSLRDKIAARTAASISLCDDFNATMVRHVRTQAPAATVDATPQGIVSSSTPPSVSVGFIGTVRPHKRLLEGALALKSFATSTGIPTTLHVYGDIRPASLLEELTEAGAKVKTEVPLSELQDNLRSLDIILSGFPGESAIDFEVTRYQITSKIGDALSVGRPILVPDGPSVSDLADTPGVFLFDQFSFADALMKALCYADDISLPETFTIEGAQAAFEDAEATARQSARAGTVFATLPYMMRKADIALQPTLVLLWKQHDAGFYGRRVDQVARSYKAACPDHRVVILELMHEIAEREYRNGQGRFTSEQGMVLELGERKRAGFVDADGVEFRQLSHSTDDKAPEVLENFLIEEAIYPENAVVILFPVLPCYEVIERVLSPYPKILDVVDNQFSWGSQSQSRQVARSLQYRKAISLCDELVFNSAANFQFFQEHGFVDPLKPVQIISNWYRLPTGMDASDLRSADQRTINLIYSGNMNDRIDWKLMTRLAHMSDDVHIHLVGTVARSVDRLLSLLESPNVIYHGPLSERDTLRLATIMDAAIMPHAADEVSAFMNPLKVHMYKAVGMPIVAMDVPGIVADDLLQVVETHEEFLAFVQSLTNNRQHRAAPVMDTDSPRAYVAMVDRVRRASSLAHDDR